jgi:nucleotide-binding universal stress UspA family protein
VVGAGGGQPRQRAAVNYIAVVRLLLARFHTAEYQRQIEAAAFPWGTSRRSRRRFGARAATRSMSPSLETTRSRGISTRAIGARERDQSPVSPPNPSRTRTGPSEWALRTRVLVEAAVLRLPSFATSWWTGFVGQRGEPRRRRPGRGVRRTMADINRLQRVLVPLDGSALSEQAVPVAIELGARLGVPARLLFAVEGWDQAAQALADSGGVFDAAEHSRLLQSSDAVLAAAHAYLEGQAGRFRDRGVQAETTIDAGRATDAILATAREAPGTLEVMASHGRGGLGRLLFGGTAQEVLARAEAPVTLVRSR